MLVAKNIKLLVVHCSDTQDRKNITAVDIHNMHLKFLNSLRFIILNSILWIWLNLILPLRKLSTNSSFAEIKIVSNNDIFSEQQ